VSPTPVLCQERGRIDVYFQGLLIQERRDQIDKKRRKVHADSDGIFLQPLQPKIRVLAPSPEGKVFNNEVERGERPSPVEKKLDQVFRPDLLLEGGERGLSDDLRRKGDFSLPGGKK